jgi:hypothetical protein
MAYVRLFSNFYVAEVVALFYIHEEAFFVKPIAGRPRVLQTSIRHLRPGANRHAV